MGRARWLVALSGHCCLGVLAASEALHGNESELLRLSLEDITGSALEPALRERGAVIVSGVPGLSSASHWALASLADCGHLTGFEGFSHKRLLDGSDRWTLAAANKEVVPWTVEQRCPGLTTSLGLLQEAVGGASGHAIDAMAGLFDSLAPARAAGGFLPLLESGRVLEHFHLYRRGPQADGRMGKEEAVPMHVDSGAVLVVTKALEFRGVGSPEQGDDTGLTLLNPRTAEEFSPRLAEDEVLILMGDSMRSFLGAEVHVPGHGVRLQHLGEGSLRAWHGRMYVFHKDSQNERGETAHSLFLAPLSRGNATSEERPWWRDEEMQGDCDTMVATCWMFQTICVPRCSDGQLQECLLPNLDRGDCSASAMDDKCKFRCPNASSNVPVGSSFCDVTVPTDMYMQGFTSVFSTAARERGCVILVFAEWSLDTPLRFAAGCIAVAFMGIFTQALLALKRVAIRRAERSTRFVSTLMYGANVVLGWFMMLVAMTYSVELFASATLGLMLGHCIFADTSSPEVLGTPCCAATEASGNGAANSGDAGLPGRAAPGQCCVNDANGQANVPLLGVVPKPRGLWDSFGNSAGSRAACSAEPRAANIAGSTAPPMPPPSSCCANAQGAD